MKTSRSRRPRRRLLRIVRRGVLLPAMLMLLAYLTIPWWLPTNWLRGQIIDQLQRDMGRPVSLAGLEVSWRDGIVLRDLRVYQTDEFGPGELARVEQISCPLTPIRTLLFRRLGRMQLCDVNVWIVRNEAGELNTDRLTLPRPSLQIAEICSDSARVHLVNRRSRHTAEIPLDAFSLRFDSQGVVRVALSGHGAYQFEHDARARELGNFAVSANVLDPYAASSSSAAVRQGGKLQLSWQTVDLASLTISDWQALRDLGLLGLSGHCGGRLELELDPTGRVSWQFVGRGSEIEIRLAQADRPVNLESAEFVLAGQFDSASSHIALSRVAVTLPGLAVEATAELRPFDQNYLALHLARVQIEPTRLRQVAPDLFDTLLRDDWRVDGDIVIDGDFVWSDRSCKIDLNVDAGELSARAPWLTRDAGRGTECSFHAAAEYRRDIDCLDVQNLQLELDGSRISLTGKADDLYAIWSGRRKLWDTWLDWSAEMAASTADGAELLARLPVLADAVGDVRVAGPAQMLVNFDPVDEPVPPNQPRHIVARQFSVNLTLPPESSLIVPIPDGELAALDKPAGESLTVSFKARFDPSAPVLESGSLLCQRGDGPDAAMVLVGPIAGKLSSSYTPTAEPNAKGQPRIDVMLDTRLSVRRIERLIQISPLLGGLLTSRDINLAGGLDGEVNLRLGGDQMRVRLALDLGGAGLQLRGAGFQTVSVDAEDHPQADSLRHLLTKSPGQPLEVEVDLAGYPTERGRYDQQAIRLAGLGVEFRGERTVCEVAGQADERRELYFRVLDAGTIEQHCPLLADRLNSEGIEVRGGLTGRFIWQPNAADADHAFELALDATDLGVARAASAGGPATVIKPVGLPLNVVAQLITNLPEGPVHPHIRLQQASAKIGRSELRLAGNCTLLPVWWDAEQWPADRLGSLIAWPSRPPPIDSVDLTIHGRLMVEQATLSALPELAAIAREWGLDGQAAVSARLTGGWRKFQLDGGLDIGELKVDRPDVFVKQARTPGRLDIKLLASPWMEILTVDRLGGQLGAMTFDATGRLHRRPGSLLPKSYELDGRLTVPDVGQIGRFMPGLLADPKLLSWPLSGRLAAQVHLFADDSDPAAPTSRPRLLPSLLELDDVRATIGGTPVAVSGRVSLSQRAAEVKHLSVTIGGSRLAAVARIDDPFSRPRGWIDLVGRTLDIDELGELWSRLQSAGLPEKVDNRARLAAGPQARAPDVSPTPGEQTDPARRIIDMLARCDIAGRVHFVDMFVSDDKNQTRYRLAEFRSRFTIDGGRIDVPFQTAMEGGLLAGRLSSDLNEAVPLLGIEYDAHRLLPTKAVQPLVEAFFPGMTVSGYVTMKESNHALLLPPAGASNWSVGKGELIFDDGVLVGQAGPDWMTRIFPGLKLTHYRFARMHDWFDLTDDGKAHHHMIFDGRDYDIYMIGWTDRATGQAEYTVGVDLLASMDSKTWSVDLRQGKIPLMYVSGRVENRKLMDQTITMVPPPVALFEMLIRDNILYRGVIERAIRRGDQEK